MHEETCRTAPDHRKTFKGSRCWDNATETDFYGEELSSADAGSRQGAVPAGAGWNTP